MSADIIRAENIAYTIGHDPEPTIILRSVSLRLAAHEIVGIVGPNGCGKSTLLRLLLGLITATHGTVERVDAGSSGAVFQHPTKNLLPWLTVLENATLAARLARDRKGQPWNETAMRALADYDLAWAARRYPSELSGGEQQLVALARWQVLPPHLLLLDEALAMLDMVQRRRVYDWLIKYSLAGGGVILVSHNVFDLAAVCTRVLVFSQRPTTVLRSLEMPLTATEQEKVALIWQATADRIQ